MRDRLIALDVFRGLAIAGMILVNGSYYVQGAYRQLLHQPWHGWTFADTIFPAFLWIVGFSITLSLAGRQGEGADRRRILRHALRRAAILFVLGMVLQPLPGFVVDYVSVAGVLQKIAVCYLVAAAIALDGSDRWVVGWIILFQVAYLAVMTLHPVPGCQDGPWSQSCNAAGFVSEAMRQSSMPFPPVAGNPDNVITTISAVSTVLIGVVSGRILLRRHSSGDRLLWSLGGGCVLMVLGELLSAWIPINKQLWTTSYVVFMAGIATVVFGACSLLASVQALRWTVKPFEVFGLNAIAAYALAIWGRNIPKVHVLGASIDEMLLGHMTAANASLCFALVNVLGVYLIVYVMYRRHWFLKL